MKKILTFLTLAFFTSIFAVQASPADEAAIKTATTDFVYAIANSEGEKLLDLVYFKEGMNIPDEARPELGKLLNQQLAPMRQIVKEHKGVERIDFKSIEVDGDTAQVLAVIVFKDGTMDSNHILMHKDKGVWKLQQ